MTRLAVTGATGRIGAILQRLWRNDVIWLGRRASGAVQADHLSRSTEIPGGVDALIHLAGPTGHADQTSGVHSDLARDAARACRASGIGHLILFSTAAVYGRPTDICREDTAAPVSDYGREKLRMEQAAQQLAGPDLSVTVLRLANVAGADMLGSATPPVFLDRFGDGRSPRRSYIGPVTLAGALCRIAAMPPDGLRLMNLAQPGIVAMSDLLDAADIAWTPRPAPDTAIAEIRLDTGRAVSLLGDTLPPANAGTLVREWRAVTA